MSTEISNMTGMDFLAAASLLLDIIADCREYDPEMQVQTLATLLIVARRGECAMSHIAEELNLSQSSVSRNVSLLSKWSRHNRPGLDLVRAYEDPAERCRKLVTLTHKGKRFMERLTTKVVG